MQDGEDRVRRALDRRGDYGPDVDVGRYGATDDAERLDDLEDAPEDVRKLMVDVGVTSDGGGREGTIVFINNGLSHCSNRSQDGVELTTVREAAARHSWLKDYFWKAVDPAKDKFTAKAYLEDSDGYFIRVRPGFHPRFPVQACMLMEARGSMQNVHNIVVVEEGASLEVITGCTTGSHALDALHIGVSEIYVQKGGSLSFSMIHSWGSDTAVRPRTGIVLGENASFVNNYVLLNPVGTLQSYPVANLNGEGATCRFNTVCLAHKGSDIDTGGAAVLNAPNTGAEIMSRSINRGGSMVARGRLVGNAPKARAHLECRSIVLEDGGVTLAIPELESTVADVEMTHEAAVGKIARDQIEYLMSRGLSEDDAVSMIVRGFLSGGIRGLPDSLKREIDAAVEAANLGS